MPPTASLTADALATAELSTSASSPPRAPVGGVEGGPKAILRVEGALVLAAALAAYPLLGGSWGLFALLFLVPDLSLLGYLGGPRLGAALYNVGHSYVGPALLAATGLSLGLPSLPLAAVVWVGHVGFDRMLGYGLKYGTRFSDTHLGRIGARGRG